MISDQVPKLIGDQFDWPSAVHGKMGHKSVTHGQCNTHQTYDYLLSRRTSPPFGQYQIILLGEQFTWLYAGWRKKYGACVLCVDQAFGQF